MKIYDEDEFVTLYIVIKKDTAGNCIQAFSDDKDLVDIYMKFHNCSKFKMKIIKAPLRDMKDMISENRYDEITISNIKTRDKNKDKMKYVQVPITESELRLLTEETNSFCGGHIGYTVLNDIFPYLKHKYQKALCRLNLDSLILKTVHNRHDEIIDNIEIDQLKLWLLWSQSDFS
jgi:hypothetical protein